jgi:hypothetical protein
MEATLISGNNKNAMVRNSESHSQVSSVHMITATIMQQPHANNNSNSNNLNLNLNLNNINTTTNGADSVSKTTTGQ